MYLGIDPDLHNLSYCYASEVGSRNDRPVIVAVGVLRVSPKVVREAAVLAMLEELSLHEPRFFAHMAAIESQEVAYTAKMGANPRDLINLAQVAGAAAASFHWRFLNMPKPQAWKGSVDKVIHQGRVLGRIGVRYEQRKDHCRPTSPPPGETPVGWDQIKPSEWIHVVDAMGLALWARDQVLGKPLGVRQ